MTRASSSISLSESQAQAILSARDALQAGELVVIPTESVYGLAALASHERARQSLLAARPLHPGESFTIHLPGVQEAELYAHLAAPMLRRFLEKIWPGPVTVVMDAAPRLAQTPAPGVHDQGREHLVAHQTVSLRCPEHDLARELLRAVPGPVVATSAAAPGQTPAVTAAAAAQAAGNLAAFVLDGGPCRYAKPSTVIRLTEKAGWPVMKMLREGVYDERTLRRMTRWTMLLVCTGNTCRSPMAEALARRLLARQRGLADGELETAGARVHSAGVLAGNGQPASVEAVEALTRLDIDLSGHRSRGLTRQMLQEADVVYAMTESHRRAVLEQMPQAAEKVFRLDPQADVIDPIGSSTDEYHQCAQQISRALEIRLKELTP